MFLHVSLFLLVSWFLCFSLSYFGSAIWAEIIHVISKLNERAAQVQFEIISMILFVFHFLVI